MVDIIECYRVSAFWTTRDDTIVMGAKQLLACIERLRECDYLFCNWYETGYSRKNALEHKVGLTIGQIVSLLQAGKQCNDFGGGILHELGYSISIWNGAREDDTIGISYTCAVRETSKLNSLTISLSLDGEAFTRLVCLDKLCMIVCSIINSIYPDIISVTSQIFDHYLLEDCIYNKAGWITYIRNEKITDKTFSIPVRIININNHGSICIASEQRLTGRNEEHRNLLIQLAREIRNKHLITLFT